MTWVNLIFREHWLIILRKWEYECILVIFVSLLFSSCSSIGTNTHRGKKKGQFLPPIVSFFYLCGVAIYSAVQRGKGGFIIKVFWQNRSQRWIFILSLKKSPLFTRPMSEKAWGLQSTTNTYRSAAISHTPPKSERGCPLYLFILPSRQALPKRGRISSQTHTQTVVNQTLEWSYVTTLIWLFMHVEKHTNTQCGGQG